MKCKLLLNKCLHPGNCTDLEVLIGGEMIGRTALCIGENVTYVCTVNTISHIWRSQMDLFMQDQVITQGTDPITDSNGFVFQRVSQSNAGITSSFSAVSFSGLDGERIECSDGTVQNGGQQVITAMVFGELKKSVHIKVCYVASCIL